MLEHELFGALGKGITLHLFPKHELESYHAWHCFNCGNFHLKSEVDTRDPETKVRETTVTILTFTYFEEIKTVILKIAPLEDWWDGS